MIVTLTTRLLDCAEMAAQAIIQGPQKTTADTMTAAALVIEEGGLIKSGAAVSGISEAAALALARVCFGCSKA